MRFGPLEIDRRLLLAQEARDEGALVIFAGAGVSRGEPSGLPDFVELASRIAGREVPKERRGQLDYFLGGLADDDHVKVHRLCIDALRPADRGRKSEPTPLHRHLVDLFREPNRIRIVTTNFDRHFETVLAEKNLASQVPVFAAPALPRGDDFHGIVHLHGVVPCNDDDLMHKATDLVLTDRDFARAYLTEGWARVFLERLFRAFTVLFIGYSHDDTPVHYIARGMQGLQQGRRFALTSDTDPRRWKRLGVEPLTFQEEKSADPFLPLTVGVAKWVTYTQSSLFETEDQIIALVAGRNPVDLTEEDASFLEGCLMPEAAVRMFAYHARGMRWVDWLEPRGLLDRFFGSDHSPLSGGEFVLVTWLARQLVSGSVAAASSVLRGERRCWHPDLVMQIALQLQDDPSNPEWALVAAGHMGPDDRHSRDYLTGAFESIAAADGFAVLPLFRVLTAPRLEVRPNWGEGAAADVVLFGSASELRAVWGATLAQRLSGMAQPLLEILVAQIRHAGDLARAAGVEEAIHMGMTGGDSRLCHVNWRDWGIADHDPAALTAMVIDAIDRLAQQSGGLPETWIAGWLDDRDAVVRRIGIYALGQSNGPSDEDKITRLAQLVEVLPEDSPERMEAKLLLDALRSPICTDTTEYRLGPIATVAAGPEEVCPMDELLALSDHDLAGHLQRARPASRKITDMLRELFVRLDDEPALVEHSIWKHLLSCLRWSEMSSTERDVVLEGLCRHPEVVGRAAQVVTGAVFRPIAMGGNASDSLSPAQQSALWRISLRLWSVLRGETIDDSRDLRDVDWKSAAWNHAVCAIVRFWIMRVAHVASSTPAKKRLPSDMEEVMTEAVSLPSGVGRRVRVLLAMDFSFLAARDASWVKKSLLPWFDSARVGDEAWAMWQGLLGPDALSERVVWMVKPLLRSERAKLLAPVPGFPVRRHHEDFATEYLRAAARCMVVASDRKTGTWLEELLGNIDQPRRERWARLVALELGKVSEGQRRAAWDGWLQQYWKRRNAGIVGSTPLPLLPVEAAIMARWAVALVEVFPGAFALLRIGPVPDFEKETFDWRELEASTLPERFPTELIEFVRFLLQHMPHGRAHYDGIAHVAMRLPRNPDYRPALLGIAATLQGHQWRGARKFRAWVEQEFGGNEPEV